MSTHHKAATLSRRAAIAVTGLWSGALVLSACSGGEAKSTESAPDTKPRESSGSAEASSEGTQEASSTTETNPDSLRVIVNKMRAFSPKEWAPQDLVEFEGHQLRKEAAEAAKKMMAAAERDGATLTVSSAYRSYDEQQRTYQHWVDVNGKEKADTVSARPGHSEHQTGLAIDFGSPDEGCLLEECYQDTKAGKWLAEHAVEYGYILRFPQGKQNITGYVFEPWHYRYLGVELAKEYRDSGKATLEEFLGTGAAPNYAGA